MNVLETEYDWKDAPKKIIKAELVKRKMSYFDLSAQLAKIGINETKAAIHCKLSRGSFSAIFFLQCLKAMEIKQLGLADDFFIDHFNEENTQ